MEALTDGYIMPFGEHKGKELINVPKGYLLWLFGQLRRKLNNLTGSESDLYWYIKDNYEAIKLEKDNQDFEEKEPKGMIVETKKGLIGKVYYVDSQVNGKTCVRLKGAKLLCDPLSLVFKSLFY